MVGGLARLRLDPAAVGEPAAHDGKVGEGDADGFEPGNIAADEAMQGDARPPRRSARRQSTDRP